MKKYIFCSSLFLASAITLCYADLNSHDTTVSASGGTDWTNPVFDVFFLGNNESAYMQTTANSKALGPWDVDYNPYNYTLNGVKIDVKQAVMDGINYWTNTITNRLDDSQQKLKIAVNFGTDSDTLIAGSEGVAQYSRCEWGKTTSFSKDNGYNKLTVIESYLREGSASFTTNTGKYNVLADSGCVDVVLSFNLPSIVRTANTSGKDFSKLISATVTHELGHAMGLSTDLYATPQKIYNENNEWEGETELGYIVADSNMTKLDTLLYLKDSKGNLTRVAKLDTTTGKVIPSNIKNFKGDDVDLTSANNLAAFGNDGALVISDGENTLQVFNGIDFGEGEGFEFVPGSSIEHLYIRDKDLLQHDILGTYSSTLEFGENDLKLIQMLGYTLAIPEPSMFGLFAGLSALMLVSTKRRRK